MILVYIVGALTAAGQNSKLGQIDLICGAHATYIALGVAGINAGSFSDFQKKLGKPDEYGYSMQQLESAVRRYGAEAKSVNCSLADIEALGAGVVPVVLMGSAHYVVILKMDKDELILADAPDEVTMSRSHFEHGWPGNAVLISKEVIPDFPSPPWPWKAIAGWTLVAIGVSAIGIAGRWEWQRRRMGV